jgi:glycerol-3-phosphate dehydrogenase
LIGGTKGSHVIVAPFPGAPTEALYVEARADRRPFFIIPWNGLLLIGTTDIRYRGDLDRVEASEAEIAYLLAEANRVLPQARLDRDAVLATYSGVRPLPYTPSGTEAAITRRHIVHDHRPELEGLISIVGGKLTTYRSLAQEAVDLAFRKLGRWRRRSVTGVAPLPGALSDVAGFARRLQRESGLSPAITGHLVRVYGGRSLEVLEMAAGTQRLLEPLGPSGTIAAEIPFAFRAEIAQTLGDALLRRTMAGLATGMAIGVDEAAAEIARRELGWDGERVSREIAAYRANLERFRPRTSAPV